jgi:mRNA interferase MazF
VIVQGAELNRSGISTVVIVPLTTNIRWATAHGNVLVAAEVSGLPQDSVANVSLIHAITRHTLDRRVGKLPADELQRILVGIDVVLGR